MSDLPLVKIQKDPLEPSATISLTAGGEDASYFLSLVAHALDSKKCNSVEVTIRFESMKERDELKLVPHQLSLLLKERSNKSNYPLFMARNEEEMMRSMLQLASEIKYVRDLPQLNITFLEQTEDDLVFSIVLAKVVGKEESAPLFINSKDSHFSLELIKEMGVLRNRHKKRAYLFYATINKSLFLRRDLSINLYKAREHLLKNITDTLGAVRDFNGGILSREKNLFAKIRSLVEAEGVHNEFLLENLFYSLSPPLMRTMVEAQLASALFVKINYLIENGVSENRFDFDLFEEGIIAHLFSANPKIQKKIEALMAPYLLIRHEFATTLIRSGAHFCLGVILKSTDPEKRAHLIEILKQESVREIEQRQRALV